MMCRSSVVENCEYVWNVKLLPLLKFKLSKNLFINIIIIINILTAIGLAPGGSSPVHIYREHYIEYTNNTQNT